MNACPNDGVLLQFLDGKLNADDDARVLAHVEECKTCQQHLERMTEGRPVAGQPPPIKAVRTDFGATVDLRPTEVIGRDAEELPTDCELGQADPTGRSDNGAGAAGLAGLAPTDEFSISPATSQGESTNRLNNAETSRADDLDRTANFPETTQSLFQSNTSHLPQAGPRSSATKSSSGWAKGAWGSSTRRGTAG